MQSVEHPGTIEFAFFILHFLICIFYFALSHLYFALSYLTRRRTFRESGEGARVKPWRQCQSMLASLPSMNVVQSVSNPNLCRARTPLSRRAEPMPPAFHRGDTKIHVRCGCPSGP